MTLVYPQNVLVFVNLRQGRLIRPDCNPVPQPSLTLAFGHAQQQMGVVILPMNRIRRPGMTRINYLIFHSKFFMTMV